MLRSGCARLVNGIPRTSLLLLAVHLRSINLAPVCMVVEPCAVCTVGDTAAVVTPCWPIFGALCAHPLVALDPDHPDSGLAIGLRLDDLLAVWALPIGQCDCMPSGFHALCALPDCATQSAGNARLEPSIPQTIAIWAKMEVVRRLIWIIQAVGIAHAQESGIAILEDNGATLPLMLPGQVLDVVPDLLVVDLVITVKLCAVGFGFGTKYHQLCSRCHDFLNDVLPIRERILNGPVHQVVLPTNEYHLRWCEVFQDECDLLFDVCARLPADTHIVRPRQGLNARVPVVNVRVAHKYRATLGDIEALLADRPCKCRPPPPPRPPPAGC